MEYDKGTLVLVVISKVVRLVEELEGRRGNMEAGLGFVIFRDQCPAHVGGRGRGVATWISWTECLLVSGFLACREGVR